MESLKAGLASLQLSETVNYRATAGEYKCVETTLRRRHQGKQRSRQDADFTYKSHLSKQQEKDLVAYINRLTGRGLPPTLPMVKNFAEDIAKKEIGKNWAYDFVQRHKDQITYDWLKGEDLCRKKVDNSSQYQAYFELVSK